MDSVSDNLSESASEVSVIDAGSFDNAKEEALIKNIRKLACENRSIKLALARHNKLIEKYCDELEKLRNHQIKEKEDSMTAIQTLEAEKDSYKQKLSEYDLTDRSKKGEDIQESIGKIKNFVAELTDSMERFKNDKSLNFPIQETHCSLEELQIYRDELKKSISCAESLMADVMGWGSKEKKLNEQVQSLRAELGERMKNNEEICTLKNKLEEMECINAELISKKQKLEKSEALLLLKIEQLEIEPSVEIMQVASPQQTKLIENLQGELAKAKEQIMSLVQENECFSKKVATMNEVYLKMSKDASQHSILEGKEISDISESYEAAIKGLKDEIEKQKQSYDDLKKVNIDLSDNVGEERKIRSELEEEFFKMKHTVEMLRRRESRDLDRLNEVTVQRDTFKKEFESRVSLIKELNGTIEALKAELGSLSNENLQGQDFSQNSLGHALNIEDDIEVLKRQLSSGERNLGILSEENTNLKMALKIKTEECCCQEFSKKIDLLVEENEHLSETLARKNEEIREQSIDEVNELKEVIRQLGNEKEKLTERFKQSQLKDSEIIQHLNEELLSHHESKRVSIKETSQLEQAVEVGRQKIDVLDARLEKSKKDYTKLWQSYEINISNLNKSEQKLKEVDELNKEARLKQSQMQKYIDETLKENQQILMSKDREIEKLKAEVQGIDIYKAQIDVYEKDFDLERKARENQHCDILVLRDRVHRLELENNRLRKEVESGQSYKVKELQRMFAAPSPNMPYPYSHDVGVYGRGGAPVSDNGMGYSGYGDYGKGSIEVPPQEPDQVMQRSCPKCQAAFPDLDSLQIHVLECVD